MNALDQMREASRPLVHRIAVMFAAPGSVTLLAATDQHPPTTAVAVLYVLAVVIAARVGGAVAGMGASVLAFLSLNFFFTPPLHTFAVGSGEDLVALFVFLVASAIVGLLQSSAVRAKFRAERRELEARLLNRLATQLVSGEPVEDVLEGFAAGICDIFGLTRCEISTEFPDTAVVDRHGAEDPGHVQNVEIAARGLEIGVIKMWLGRRERLDEEELRVIGSIATQLALALEGMRLSREVREAELEAQASQLKADLFSGVTHDVKTPLAGIMAAVTSLIDGRGFSERQHLDHLDTIKQEAERLHRVVNNLLDVARLRAGTLVPAKVPSPIDELLESVINRLRPLLGDRTVEMRVGDNIPDIPMDVVQLDQVLTNLIENAIKFTPPHTPITLSAVGHSGAVRVTVSDRGPGVAPEKRDRVFEPFERGPGAGAGTGLGLAIAKAIVAAHGGRMWVSEAPGGGAAFTFELHCDMDHAGEAVRDAGTGVGR